MQTSPRARVGVVRPSGTSHLAAVAELEARVIATELERRLGPLAIDLRTDGPAVGPWQPREHAAWPSAVDAVVELGDAWSAPLTLLAARTVDPAAAAVRGRMLRHLGIITDPPAALDAAALDELRAFTVRPVDLLLIARAAPEVRTGDPAVDALAAAPDDPRIAALDEALDAALADVALPDGAGSARLTGELADLRARVATLEAEAHRAQVEAAARIDDLLQERAVLRERLERAELDLPSTSR